MYVEVDTNDNIAAIIAMEKHLGRKLKPGEKVRYRSPDHYDLSLDNLELYTGDLPKGYRVKELVIYARKIIEMYDKPEIMNM